MKAFLKSTTSISARIFGVIGTVLAGQLTEASVPSPIRGATIYSLCSTCHGPKGEGVHKLETPPLTGLSANYVESQLRKFRDGRRGAHHADVKGLMMRAMARVLIRDEDLVAVSQFVGSHDWRWDELRIRHLRILFLLDRRNTRIARMLRSGIFRIYFRSRAKRGHRP